MWRRLLIMSLLLICLPSLAAEQQPTFLGQLPAGSSNNLRDAANQANNHAQRVIDAVKQARQQQPQQNTTTQLKNTIRAFESFRIQSNQRIIQLEQQNNALREQIQNLGQQLAEYSQNASTTVLQLQPSSSAQQETFTSKLNHLLGNFDIKLSLGLLALILLTLIWLIFRPSKASQTVTPRFHQKSIVVEPEFNNAQQTESNLDDEYDFLGSREGIPAKLDLARAYIDMGENVNAMEILQDVLAKGDPSQQVEAESLMNKVAV